MEPYKLSISIISYRRLRYMQLEKSDKDIGFKDTSCAGFVSSPSSYQTDDIAKPI